MNWEKASYGKTASKSGGSKLKGIQTEGNRGIPSGTSAPKSSVGRIKGGIDTPTTTGNKGVDVDKGFQSTKAPKS